MNTYIPYVAPGDFSYAWVMLTGDGDLEVVQIGPRSEAGATQQNWTFAFWADGACPTCEQGEVYLAGKIPGSEHEYKVTYNAADHVLKYWVDGGKIGESAPLSWTPTGAILNGEISGRKSQMMGRIGEAAQAFHDNYYRLGDSTVQWTPATGTTNNSDVTHFGQTGSAFGFYVWDKCV
jgi:hypothetical protein